MHTVFTFSRFGFLLGVVSLFTCTYAFSATALNSPEEEAEYLRCWDRGWDRGFELGWDARGAQLPDIAGKVHSPLKGLKKVVVSIKCTEGGVDYSCLIRNYVESRLRSVGIDIVDKAEDLDSAIIVIRHFTDKKVLFVNMWLYGYVLIPRHCGDNMTHYEYFTDLWREKSDPFDYHTTDPKADIRNFLQEALDKFTNEWFKENPKAISTVPEKTQK